MKTEANFSRVVCCPDCKGEISTDEHRLFCGKCNNGFQSKDGVVFFEGEYQDHTSDSAFQVDQMSNNTLLAKAYNLGSSIISSDYEPAAALEGFMSAVPDDAIVVELGSGSRRLSPNIINVDLFPFDEVDFVADIMKSPFKDDSVDYIVLDTVLEHVPEPQQVVDEMFRILAPGGKVFCVAPLIAPYHGYPKHYFNYTKDGLEYLFRKFRDNEVSTNIGPTAAMTHFVSEYFSLIFSGKSNLGYTVAKGLFLAPIFYFKYLDFFLNKTENSKRIASLLSLIATK
jgi:predicted SAM-dependent methyltransferase